MDKDIIEQFKNEMMSAVRQWQAEELALYNTFPEEIWPAESWNVFRPTLEEFPDFIWEVWFSYLNDKTNRHFTYGRMDREAIQKAFERILSDKEKSVDKGLGFEEIGADIRNDADSFIRQIGEIWFGSKDAFPHTGSKMYREDFEMTRRYTIDFKYSDIEGEEKYRNIIKTAGKSSYKNIQDLKEGIMRSMYSVGKNYGEGLLFRFDEGVFKELRQLDYVTGTNVWQENYSQDIPDPRRKILIYLFQDGGSWASKCLEYTIDWAIQELKSGRFNDLFNKYGYVPAKEFWHFTNYGSTTKDDII